MAHAGVKTGVKAVVQVSQRFGGGRLQVMAVGHQCGQSSRQRFASAGKNSFEALKFFAVKNGFRRRENIVDKLVWRRNAGHQHIRHADACSGLGDVAWRRVSLAGPVRQQPAPQATVVANQHCGLRQQELAKRILVAFNFAVVPPRQIRHIGHKWYVGVVGCDHRDGADILGAADKTDLDRRNGHVFQG